MPVPSKLTPQGGKYVFNDILAAPPFENSIILCYEDFPNVFSPTDTALL